MATFTTPLMSLALPVSGPGGEAGPTWADDLNNAFTLVDSHNHTSGSGALIPTTALNINADLTFNGYNAITLRSVRLAIQGSALSATSDKSCLYTVGGDLYYNNGAGTSIPVTSGSAVNVAGVGGITGMGATTASVTYAAPTFTFITGAAKAANISCAAVSIADTATSAQPITLKSPVALGAAYNMILPTGLPGAGTKIMTLTSAGQMAAAYDVDNSTLTISSNSLQIANGGVTQVKRAPLGQQVSASCGTFTTTSAVAVDVTNLSVTITTTGRPVFIALIPDGTASQAFLSESGGSAIVLSILRGATPVGIFSSNGNAGYSVMPGMVCIDVPAAGTYTYKVQVSNSSGSDTTTVKLCKLIAFEL